ncbi:MAG: lysoplasmalogenase [candidate division KSB1 bacterium]|nr:lysoplasmalogenase [candidate division KSB1 bacterium]
MQSFFLLILLSSTVTLLIRAELSNQSRQVYIFKPLSTVIVILTALLSFFGETRFSYSFLILIGLLFSLGGDIALMFHGKKFFLIGLVSFLFAHIVYTIAFGSLGDFSKLDLWTATALGLAGIVIYHILRAGLGALKLPVIFYMVVISVMVNRAFSVWANPACSSLPAGLISSGAVLFYLSDAILALNRFAKPLRYERFSLVPYYLGQFFIALSTYYVK